MHYRELLDEIRKIILVRQYFVEADAVNLILPERSVPRVAPDFTISDA